VRSASINSPRNRLLRYAGAMLLPLLLPLLPLLPLPSQAQTKSLVPTTPLLLVTPLVGAVAEPRALTLTGQWPDTCVPVAATLDTSVFTVTQTVIIRLQVPLTLAPCAQVLTPYRFEIPYTAGQVGVSRVLIVSSNGRVKGEGRIVTAPAGVTRAAGNITGAWFDPATNGSGLSFVHAYQGSDTVFGAWYLYDKEGIPRWFSIQGVKWSDGGTVMEGSLYESRAGADVCAQTVIACPATSVSATPIGRVRAKFEGIWLLSDTVPQGRIEAFSNSGVPLFASNIIRAF
jgi:hypothetical protein